jgi:predicted RNA-binding protein
MKKIKIFLASSKELNDDRNLFEIHIYRKCKEWLDKGIFLDLEIWEDMSARLVADGSQSEYNKVVKDCNLFVLLAYTKVGAFTEEEFTNAFDSFKAENKPFIFTYFKETTTADESLEKFKKKLRDMKHYISPYKDFNDLWNKFNKELERLDAAKFEKNEFGEAAMNSNITGDKNINIQGGTGNQISINTGNTTNQHAEKIINIDKIDTANF